MKKKKVLWVFGVVIAAAVVLVVALSVIVKTYLTSDRLKAMIVPRVEKRLDAQVQLGEIRVSVFKGIVVKDISLSRDGQDLLTAKDFVLDYSLLPLLGRRLVIKRIVLDSPHVYVRRYRGGAYNFEGLVKTGEEKAPAPEQAEAKGLPVSVVTDALTVRDARFDFTDETGSMPGISARAGLHLRFSLEKTVSASGSLELDSLKTAPAGIETNTSGTVRFDPEKIDVSLRIDLGGAQGDSMEITGSIKNYMNAPDIRLDLHAAKLDLARLMPKERGKKAAREAGTKLSEAGQRQTVVVRVAMAGGKKEIRAEGNIRVDALRYKDYEIRDFASAYRYENGLMQIKPVSMRPASAGIFNASGEAGGEFYFNYAAGASDPVGAIRKTLRGNGVVTFGEGKIRRSAMTEAIALFTGVKELAEPGFKSARFDYTVKNQRVFLEGAVTAPLFNAVSAGTVGFDRVIDLTANIRISPELTPSVSAKIASYISEEESGWSSMPLRITGTAEKPSVGLDTKAVRKKLEKTLKEKIEEDIRKKLPKAPGAGEEKPGGGGAEDLIKGLLGR
jgi:AsmA protein